MAIRGKKKEAAPRPIARDQLLEQLDREWQEGMYQATLFGEPEREADTMAIYAQDAMRRCVYWLDDGKAHADPYQLSWPEAAKKSRVYAACTWLAGISDGRATIAREQMLATLLKAWPPYRDAALPEEVKNGSAPLDYELKTVEVTWEGIVGHWAAEDEEAPRDQRVMRLPAFGCKASENWHMACMCLLYLNRRCNYALADLSPRGGS